MAYRFAPAPAYVDPLVRVSDSGLSKEQLDRLTGYGDVCVQLQQYKGNVGFSTDSHYDPDARISAVGWFSPGLPETAWVYQFFESVIQHANAQFWRFDLWGFYDDLQYLQYPSGTADGDGHFAWHMDMGDKYGRPQRKLSVSLLLSDPDEYAGGDFYFFDGSPRKITEKARGTIVVFPAWAQHCVAPVTWGVRRSLVAWACGERFK